MSFITKYLPYYKRNLIVAIPVMFSQLGQVLVQQADNMMVGAVGHVELAAASFANSVYIIGMCFGMGFTFGLTPLVGHTFAKKDTSGAGELLKNSFLVNMIMTLALVLVMYLVSYLMKYMGQPAEVLELAVPYYRILVVSIIPFLMFFTFKQFGEGVGNTIYAMIITLTVNVVNVLLNWVLIFGKLGFDPMGLNGAGIATFIARVCMPLLFFIVFVKDKKFNTYLKEAYKASLNSKIIRKLFAVGGPISLQMIVEVSAFAISGVMMGWLGAVALASHQIALGLASLTFMIATGIGSGTTIRISHQYSAGDYNHMENAARASVHLVLTFMGLTALCFIAFRQFLPWLYTEEASVSALASQLLIMAAIFQLFDGLQLVMLSILRGLADVKKAMVYAFISFIIINVPLSYYLTFTLEMGPKGIWIGFIAGLGIASMLFLSRYIAVLKKIKS